MSQNTSNNKRLAINTIILYIKLIVSSIISFWISRVVLQALGANDFGLYNVVGGIVAMLNVLATSMIATSSRYLAVELGKGKIGDSNRIYNTVFTIHFALAILLVVLGETIGIYYVRHYLNVDPTKIDDAIFVLHMSLLTTAFAVISVPANGLIVAREKFLFTSIMEIISSVFKLVFIFFLMYYGGNKLRLYAIILAIAQFMIPFSYQIYCQIKDRSIVRWKFNRNISDYKEIVGFAVWMLIGAMAVVGKIQGAAMIINYFFGTILNAAFGLASQVFHAVANFTSTLRQAAIPQIMKSQENDENRSLNLVYVVSKYSYLTMNILALPILICIDEILELWLGDYPQDTEIFVIFMLISGMVSNLGAGFDASIQATGKVRKNQIGYSIINLSLLPIIFVLYKMGFPPYANVITIVILAICTLIFQCKILTELTSFKIGTYVRRTIIPSLSSTSMALFPLLLFHNIMPKHLAMICAFLVIGALWTIISIYICGVPKEEKKVIKTIVYNKVNHKLKTI